MEVGKSPNPTIESTELQKLMKQRIRLDIRNYEEAMTKEVIENSSRRVEKELANGFRIINKLKDETEIVRTGKNNVMNIATTFYEKLYAKQPQSNNAGDPSGTTV